MGSLGDELSLGSICGSQRRASKIMMNDKVEEHVKKLEEEKRKIKSWELELPLSLQLLNNEILYLKEENKRCLEMNTQPLLQDLTMEKPNYDDHISKLERNDKECSMLLDPKVETDLGLSLTSSSIRRKDIVASSGSTSISMPQPQPPAFLQKQALRKQRRCWTPVLHRRFVDALQHLGGPGVATPKQIREHMKVEGLTNDEVKSHLQKYRLYIRKPNSNAEKQSEVVSGFKLWNSSQDEEETSEEGECSKTRNLQSNSPQGPLQLLSTTTGGDSNIEDAAQS